MGYYRILPELGREASCSLILCYLLECIRQDVHDNDEIDDRWEAARLLHFWLRQLHESGDASDAIVNAVGGITDLFLTSGKEIRLKIEQGFLEHALETAALRPYFEPWSKDDRLRETWKAAIAWQTIIRTGVGIYIKNICGKSASSFCSNGGKNVLRAFA